MDAEHANDRLWLVVRSLRPDGYKIRKNDILKIGRVKFKVREFKTDTESFDITKDGDKEEFEETKYVVEPPKEEMNEICRFCWTQEYSDDNPKIKACNCQGSVKYVHYACLKAWLHTKL